MPKILKSPDLSRQRNSREQLWHTWMIGDGGNDDDVAPHNDKYRIIGSAVLDCHSSQTYVRAPRQAVTPKLCEKTVCLRLGAGKIYRTFDRDVKTD